MITKEQKEALYEMAEINQKTGQYDSASTLTGVLCELKQYAIEATLLLACVLSILIMAVSMLFLIAFIVGANIFGFIGSIIVFIAFGTALKFGFERA